jgi:hypothetical protein
MPDDGPYSSTAAILDGGRDAKRWSCVRMIASAARGDDTTRFGAAPRRRSMRPSGACVLERLQRET